MFGIGKGFLGGLIGLFFFSIIVFFVIYLLVPEVSLRFFGISVNSDEYVRQAAAESVNEAQLPDGIASEIESYLSSPEGEEFIARAQESAGGAAEDAISFFSSEGFRSFVREAGEFVAAGAGSVRDFFSENGQAEAQ